jgi:hypothetical protein
MPNPYAYPRPEYPRPDRQRGTVEGWDWLNLNGPWQFRFDGERIGEKDRWFKPGGPVWREQILVPFPWESLAAWGEGDAAGNDNYYSTRVFRNPLEVNRQNHRYAPRYEVGWYRREVTIPQNEIWDAKRAILTIGAADFFTDVWCNGVHLGQREGGYLPHEFDITDALEVGNNGLRHGTIVIRVEDPIDNKEQPVGKQWRWYTTTSGIWQTVWLEPRSPVFIDRFRISPDISAGSARFEIFCGQQEKPLAVEIEITAPDGSNEKITSAVKQNCCEKIVPINPIFLWNPNEPHLYWVTMNLKDGERVVDSVRTYFGMRKIDHAPTEDTTAPEALCLNGVARYLRGALHQAYYPEGVYTAGDVERFKEDILYAKKVGFNFLRVHIKIEDPLFLYYADKFGMLVMADFPNFGEGGDTEQARQRYEAMMRKAIDRDFNHPCIFAWCLFNETWGFGGQLEIVEQFSPLPKNEDAAWKPIAEGNPPPGGTSGMNPPPAVDAAAAATAKVKLANTSSHSWVQKMWELAKTLDKTRLIEDMSVVHWQHLDYYAHGDTDINSWHFYLHDYDQAKEHIGKVASSTYTGSTFNYVEGFKQRGQPLINSEYGGIGCLDGDRDVSWSFKFLTNELRRHSKISGYIYTELHDTEWEYNGFLNYDRTPKQFGYDPRIINESDTLPVDYAPISRASPGQRISVPVDSSHYSTKIEKDVILQWHLAGIDTLGKTHHLTRGAKPIPFPHRRVARAHMIELEMPQATMLCTLSIEAIRRENGERVAANFIQFLVSGGYPFAREETPRALILRAHPADWARCEWSGYQGEREEERRADACWGFGHGFFEWDLPLLGADIRKALRMRIICEASSRRGDTPQTDDDRFPSNFQMIINGTRVHESVLQNHPHDARGALSYLRQEKGAYGYLIHSTAEGDLMREIADQTRDHIHLSCGVPRTALAQNGLQIYGAECGRYPICPTVVIEW